MIISMMDTAPQIPLPEKQVELLFGDIRRVNMNPLDIGLGDVAGTMNEIGGAEVVLELVASGRMPSEIAASYNLPQMGFRRWVQDNISPVELAEAFVVGAETQVFKATALLSMGAENKAEAEQARLLSQQLMKIAERLDPGRWAPRKDAGTGGGMAVSIRMDFGGGRQMKVGSGVRDVTPVEEASAPAALPRIDEVTELPGGDIGELLRSGAGGGGDGESVPAAAAAVFDASMSCVEEAPHQPSRQGDASPPCVSAPPPVPPPPPSNPMCSLAATLDAALARPATWEG